MRDPVMNPRDHGGDLDRAIARHGGRTEDWIDLSTGINRLPYPLPEIPGEAWTALPRRAAGEALLQAARNAYGSRAPILALAGAQAAIQSIPRLDRPGQARILAPTYNEHAACLSAAGWRVEEVARPEDLAGADLAVAVNPNNPDGRRLGREALLDLSARVGRLVVDESFVETAPALSVADRAGENGLLVLRSFGKFYGLAGVRLGFALGGEEDIARLSALAGPWPVSGPAIAVATRALADEDWRRDTLSRLRGEAARLDALAVARGWEVAGGTALFRLYAVPKAAGAQALLARHRIWSRIFPARPGWIRLGLPGGEAEWARLEAALAP